MKRTVPLSFPIRDLRSVARIRSIAVQSRGFSIPPWLEQIIGGADVGCDPP